MILSVGKTKFKLSFSFVALIVLMIIVCDEKVVLYSLTSSLVHESGHLFFMCASGDKPDTVVFTLFGMRIDRAADVAALSYKKELLIALGGIIFNSAFAGICFVAYLISGSYDLLMLSAVNLVVVAVNSLPVYVLDCGRAVRYALLICTEKEKSEKYADAVSDAFIIIFTVASIGYFLAFGVNISLFCINLYLIFITLIKKWS